MQLCRDFGNEYDAGRARKVRSPLGELVTAAAVRKTALPSAVLPDASRAWQSKVHSLVYMALYSEAVNDPVWDVLTLRGVGMLRDLVFFESNWDEARRLVHDYGIERAGAFLVLGQPMRPGSADMWQMLRLGGWVQAVLGAETPGYVITGVRSL